MALHVWSPGIGMGTQGITSRVIQKVWKSKTSTAVVSLLGLVTVWPTDGKCWRTGSFYIHPKLNTCGFNRDRYRLPVNAWLWMLPLYICRQIGNVWEAISNIMQSVGFSSPLKILIQKQLALTSWGGLLSGAYFHLCKPYRGEFREVQSLRFSLRFRQIRKIFTSQHVLS